MKKRNAALSTVLSTVILSSVLLTITCIASYAANNAVNVQIENVQFDQAKNVLLSLDQVVKKGMLTQQSYGYVRASFMDTIPQFAETGETLTMTIVDQQNHSYQVPVNIVKIKGGSYVGVLTPEVLLGDNSLILKNASSSIGRVKVFQEQGAWTSLDYERVRCIYAGTSNYYNGTGWDEKGSNVFEIMLMNVTFGVLEFGTQAYITVRNIGVNSAAPIQASKNASIRVNSGGEVSSCSLGDLVRDCGGDPEKSILIHVVIVNIEISMLGG